MRWVRRERSAPVRGRPRAQFLRPIFVVTRPLPPHPGKQGAQRQRDTWVPSLLLNSEHLLFPILSHPSLVSKDAGTVDLSPGSSCSGQTPSHTCAPGEPTP